MQLSTPRLFLRVLAAASAFALFANVATPTRAADASKATPSPTVVPSLVAVPLLVPVERTVVTHHTVRVDGTTLAYTATAGTILLRDDKDEPTASVFFAAYTVPGAHRPVTFAYNGGPGSSSMWLHIGSIGPRRIITTDAGTSMPPYELADNAQTLLDRTDLVFIDAVGTGFSTLVGKGEGKDFYGIDQDARAFAQFVRRYVTQFDRWNAPKFLFGESYGTMRSAILVNILQNEGMTFNGVVLVSTVLNFSTLRATVRATISATPCSYPRKPRLRGITIACPTNPRILRRFFPT